jgi:heme o synthase
MQANSSVSINSISIKEKLKEIGALCKLRLTFLVVVSAVFGYMYGATEISYSTLLWLSLAGFLVTGSSNAFNQVIEKELDRKMKRTSERPLVTGKLSVSEGLFIASLFGVFGLLILFFLINPLSGILGTLAIFMYTLLYTPLKRITPWAVFVGAFPGAIPPMLGYVAATGSFGLEPGILFAMQFMWQFPHFWAIAWVLDDDYSLGGFRLLPSKSGRGKTSAFITLTYTLFIIPVSLLPWMFEMSGNFSAIAVVILSVAFAYLSWKLYRTCETKDAKILMFASFIYLPLVQLFYLVDKL